MKKSIFALATVFFLLQTNLCAYMIVNNQAVAVEVEIQEHSSSDPISAQKPFCPSTAKAPIKRFIVPPLSYVDISLNPSPQLWMSVKAKKGDFSDESRGWTKNSFAFRPCKESSIANLNCFGVIFSGEIEPGKTEQPISTASQMDLQNYFSSHSDLVEASLEIIEYVE